MATINTAMGALGTIAAAASLFSNKQGGATNKYGDFISEIRSTSVARTNLFEVTITAPVILSGTAVARKISLYAEGTSLPGLFLNTIDVKRFGIGPNEAIPYSHQTNDCTINFIGDGKGEIYKFFYNWLHGIVRADTPVPAQNLNRNGLQPYEVEFKENYRSTITVRTFNEQGQTILEYNLSDAFPANVPDVALSWAGNSEMMQFPVTFKFLQSQLTTADATLELTKSDSSLTNFQKLVKIGTAIQVITSLRKPTSVADAINVIGNTKRVLGGLSSNL